MPPVSFPPSLPFPLPVPPFPPPPHPFLCPSITTNEKSPQLHFLDCLLCFPASKICVGLEAIYVCAGLHVYLRSTWWCCILSVLPLFFCVLLLLDNLINETKARVNVWTNESCRSINTDSVK